jgi:hypothetical protein
MGLRTRPGHMDIDKMICSVRFITLYNLQINIGEFHNSFSLVKTHGNRLIQSSFLYIA